MKNQSLGWWVLLGIAASACGGVSELEAEKVQDGVEQNARYTAQDEGQTGDEGGDEGGNDEGELPWWGEGPPPWWNGGDEPGDGGTGGGDENPGGGEGGDGGTDGGGTDGGGDGGTENPNPPNPPNPEPPAPPAPNPCAQVELGEYNLFVKGNYTQGHDVQGKVAAGGDVSMTYFAVGGSLAANNTSNVLVAGGNLFVNSGSIYGNAYYGGYTTAGQNVTVHRGTLSKGTPIDFAARFTQLEALSAHLASNPNPTGTTRIETWGGLFLEGNKPGVNTFNVDASTFGRTVYFNINAPANSRVIINIRGASARFANFGQSFSGGINQKGVLFNFVDATKIEATSYGFWGTILAPYADMTFNNGSWDGGIYARSLTGTAEGHVNPLDNFEYCKPAGGV